MQKLKQQPLKFQDYQFTATKEESYQRADRSIQQFINKNLTLIKKKDGSNITTEELLAMMQQANISLTSNSYISSSSGVSTIGANLIVSPSSSSATSSHPIGITHTVSSIGMPTTSSSLATSLGQPSSTSQTPPPLLSAASTPTLSNLTSPSVTSVQQTTLTTTTITPPINISSNPNNNNNNNNINQTLSDSNLSQVDLEYQLSYTHLVQLPTSIYQLVWIQKLVLTHHNIKTLSEDIGRLQQLQVLILENNRLISLPQAIGDLVNLKRLEIDNNLLTSLCSLERLSKLEVLSVNNNKLTLLPTSIASLSSLKTLNIKSNPIITPPATIVSKGLKDIVNFLRELETGARPCLRSKLIVLGDSGVGKSSIIQQIKGKKKKSNLNSGNEGIEIDSYEYDVSFDEDDKKRRSITLSTWDILNQEVYFATNQIFVSERSVYVIVWDLTKGISDSNLEYWLHCISSTAPNSPIVLVGTHIDAFESLETVNQILETTANRFQKKFTLIQAIISVSCTTGYDVDKLKQLIEDIIKTQPYLKEKVPSSFFTLEEALMDSKKKRNPPVMNWQEYVGLANICNLKDTVQIQRATEFLHNIGSIVYFNGSAVTSNVGKLIILDPQWIINCMSQLITARSPSFQEGIVKKQDLETIWKPPTYPDHLREALLSIMQAFEICHPLSPSDFVKEANDKDSVGDRLLVPNLLPESSSQVKQWINFVDPDSTRLNRQYHLPFIPEKFFGKLIIRLMSFVRVEACQKRALVVSNSVGHEALIELRTSGPSNRKILTVDVRGLPDPGLEHDQKTPVQLLRVLTDTIESLFSQWYKLDIKRYISCYECQSLNDINPTLFTIEECEFAVMDGKTVLTCFQKAIDGSEERSPPHRLKLNVLAPDISMVDIPRSKFDIKEIKLNKEVGRGAFGIVYEAEWKGEPIALKMLLPSTGDESTIGLTDDPDQKLEDRLKVFREFRHEVYSMSRLNHPSIMKITGFCIQPLSMALEYIRYGSLYSFLSNNTHEVNWGLRLQIASEIAKGMQHLHSHNPPVIHRDLKSPNILLNSFQEGPNQVSSIIDFGTSTALYGGAALVRTVDQPLWLAPEVLSGTVYSEPSDVYAFGIILWELYTRSHPFDEFSFGQWMSKLEDEIIRGLRPTIPATCPPEYVELIQSCWTHEPSSRPTFTSIVESINQLKKKFIPLPFQHSPHIRNMIRKSRSSSISESMLPSNFQFNLTQPSTGVTQKDNNNPNTNNNNNNIGTIPPILINSGVNNTSSSSLSSSLTNSGILHHSPSAEDFTMDSTLENDDFLDIFTEEDNEQPYPFSDDTQKGVVTGIDEELQLSLLNSNATSGTSTLSANTNVVGGINIVTASTIAKLIEMMTKGEASVSIPGSGSSSSSGAQPTGRKRSDTAGKSNIPPPQWRNSVPLSSSAVTTLDESFIDDFLNVYRSFSTPKNVFKLLVRRFFGPKNSDKCDSFVIKKFEQKKPAIRAGIAYFTKKWTLDITELEYKQEEFWLYHNITMFTKQFILPEFPQMASQIFQVLQTYENESNLTNQKFLQMTLSESDLGFDLSSSAGSSTTSNKEKKLSSSFSPISLNESTSSTSTSGGSIGGTQYGGQKSLIEAYIRDPLTGLALRERKFKKTAVRCFTATELIDWISRGSAFARNDAAQHAIKLLNKQFILPISEDGQIINQKIGNINIFQDTNNSYYTFLDEDPELIALQYTFVELTYLQSIHPRELLGYSVGLVMPTENEKDPEKWKQTNFPHIYEYLKWFNRMSLLVSSEIIKQRDVKIRSEVVEKYIKIACEYLSLWNFNGIMQILSALHSEPIARLANTWAKVSQKSIDCFNDLSRLMLPESNYLPLRTVLAQSPHAAITSSNYPHLVPYMSRNFCPTIPFLGAFIADLSQTSTENQTFISSGGEKMVNILRVKRLSKKMKMFKEYREMKISYLPLLTTPRISWFKEYINDFRPLDPNQIDRLSELERKLEISAGQDGKEKSDDKDGKGDDSSSPLRTDIFGVNAEELTERDWIILLTNASVITYHRGDVVIEENTINSHLYRIKTGSLAVEKKNKEGKLVKVATMLAPKMFGEMSFLGNKTTARLSVEEEADLYVMDIPFLNNLFNSHPRLGAKFYKIMANQLAIRLKNLPWSKPASSSSSSGSTPNTANGSPSNTATSPIKIPHLPSIVTNNIGTPPSSPRYPPPSSGTTPTTTTTASGGITNHPIRTQSTIHLNVKNLSSDSGSQSNTPRGDGGRQSLTRAPTIVGIKLGSSSGGSDQQDDKSPVMKKNDQEFISRFNLKEDEIVIKDYACSLNRSGRLYISQQHVCFYSKFFGYKTKKVIPIKTIEKVFCVNVNQIELTRMKNTISSSYRLTFSTQKEREDAYGMINILWESSKHSATSPDEIKRNLQQERNKVANATLKTRSNKNKGDELTKEDWELIGREGSRCTIYKKDEVIVCEGEKMQRIYQIGRGSVRIEKSVPIAPGSMQTRKVTLGTMKQDDTFGEITYLLSGEATAHVVADSDQVEVYAIEGQFVNILFDLNPYLASKWFKYLATALNKTLIERESQLYS
ncbi:RasGEF domain-containing protein [Tieghemostelium lacteum]|uniref:non-specific serine/threonine protein kinase n=1 Tax=Tieghemostelium lacteum TaxID=361077 RepID=A0A151ZK51_TIELA|nr:RasGEF domain-containing protein [Tieghemostelium lacteum]|eukprot:KYQ94307.1 RasGEF domain-containing protein [Tieghemostelium lacteum]